MTTGHEGSSLFYQQFFLGHVDVDDRFAILGFPLFGGAAAEVRNDDDDQKN